MTRSHHVPRRLRRGLQFVGSAIHGPWYSLVRRRVRRQARGTDTLVVVHVFHRKAWGTLGPLLQRLERLGVPAVVTLPVSNVPYLRRLRRELPSATAVVVPNRGRDVLPFVQVAKALKDIGVRSVLKLHSKVTSDIWVRAMLDELVPASDEQLRRLIELSREPQTGVVGAGDTYFPLAISSTPEQAGVMTLSRRWGGSVPDPWQNGYFAGTMFWARLEAIGPILTLPVREFDLETGQYTGRLAHTLERLFTVVPELAGLTNYEVQGGEPWPRRPGTSEIPLWYMAFVHDAHRERLEHLVARGSGWLDEGA